MYSQRDIWDYLTDIHSLSVYILAPDVPRIVQAYSKHSDSITVVFTEVAGATGYTLRAMFPSGDFFSETMVNSSPATVVGLQPYTNYKLSIMSINSGGRSQASNAINALTGK